MSTEDLYHPALLSSWPMRLLRPVGSAYRNAAGEGLDHAACMRLATAAYLAVGGKPADAERAVQGMIASLAAEMSGWLWEPAQAWLEEVSFTAPYRALMPRSACLLAA